MYVIYHSSDLFSSVTGVSMLSLFENNKEAEEIHILYIERGISDKNKEFLKRIADQYGRTIEFMPMPDWSEKLNTRIQSCKKGWLGFGFNRLFLTEYIPESVDRVLYLDSDTVIESSLTELWNTDMTDCYLAGVDDCLSAKYREIVELGEEGIYVNAGMLLVNLKKWREDSVTDKFIRMIEKNNGYFVFNEQSVLNSAFSGKIKILPQQYNVNSLVYLFEYKELLKLRKPYHYSVSQDEFYSARKAPVITHFTGNFYVAKRPWIQDSDHPHKDAFLHYRGMTPWKDEPLFEDTRSKKSRFFTSLCHVLPRKMMIFLVSVLYNDLRPLSLKRKKSKNIKKKES